MSITYLGHSAFEIKINDKKILIDPFLVKKPNYDYSNVMDIFVTHGHGDHLGSAIEISLKTGAKITAIFELANYCAAKGANINGINFIPVCDEFNPIENGSTFVENSTIKASTASKLMKEFALADDTGLCVDALDGRPGLHSARYAPTQQEKITKILDELKGQPAEKRTARFICSMVLTNPQGEVVYSTEGICEGNIAFEPYGNGGFGYDPIFNVKGLDKTMAEFTAEEKNSLSHRAKALNPMLDWIKANL